MNKNATNKIFKSLNNEEMISRRKNFNNNNKLRIIKTITKMTNENKIFEKSMQKTQ